MQSQTAVSAYFTSKHIPHFVFAWQYWAGNKYRDVRKIYNFTTSDNIDRVLTQPRKYQGQSILVHIPN